MAQLVTCSATWAASHGFETLHVPNFSPERKSRKKYWSCWESNPDLPVFTAWFFPLYHEAFPEVRLAAGRVLVRKLYLPVTQLIVHARITSLVSRKRTWHQAKVWARGERRPPSIP